MTWHGPALDDEQREVLALMDDLLDSQKPLNDEQPDMVERAKSQLSDLGLWTLGVSEDRGGSGAPREMALLVLERLGRLWPALGWASIQAQAAIGLIGSDERFSELVSALNAATAAIAVVDVDAAHVRLDIEVGRVTGTIDRVDPASSSVPTVVVLGRRSTAYVLRPEDLRAEPVERTGLGGAGTISLTVDAATVETVEADLERARGLLRLGAAAVAAGIAGAAADAAVGYAAGREQFGAPLTALATVRQSLQVQAAVAAVALTAVFGADPNDPSQTAGVLANACDRAIDVAARALQSHGGYGYLTEYPAERFLRDAVSLRAASDAMGAMTRAASTMAEASPRLGGKGL